MKILIVEDEPVLRGGLRDLNGLLPVGAGWALQEAATINERASGPYPYWWGWFNWLWWWHHFNGVGRIRWTVTLESSKSLELSYTWNYYWQ
jgi:hypothetical protein